MLTDIEIAKQADIKPISDIAEKLGIHADELEFYGKYKAKLPLSLLKKYESREDGKLFSALSAVGKYLRKRNGDVFFPAKSCYRFDFRFGIRCKTVYRNHNG